MIQVPLEICKSADVPTELIKSALVNLGPCSAKHNMLYTNDTAGLQLIQLAGCIKTHDVYSTYYHQSVHMHMQLHVCQILPSPERTIRQKIVITGIPPARALPEHALGGPQEMFATDHVRVACATVRLLHFRAAFNKAQSLAWALPAYAGMLSGRCDKGAAKWHGPTRPTCIGQQEASLRYVM